MVKTKNQSVVHEYSGPLLSSAIKGSSGLTEVCGQSYNNVHKMSSWVPNVKLGGPFSPPQARGGEAETWRDPPSI